MNRIKAIQEATAKVKELEEYLQGGNTLKERLAHPMSKVQPLTDQKEVDNAVDALELLHVWLNAEEEKEQLAEDEAMPDDGFQGYPEGS